MALGISVRVVLVVESAPLAAVAVDLGALVVPARQQAAVLEQQQAAVLVPELAWAAWVVELVQVLPDEVVPVPVAVGLLQNLVAVWSARPRGLRGRALAAARVCTVAVVERSAAA